MLTIECSLRATLDDMTERQSSFADVLFLSKGKENVFGGFRSSQADPRTYEAECYFQRAEWFAEKLFETHGERSSSLKD